MTWRTVKIGDVCLVKRGTTITEKQAIKGSVPVVAGGISYSYKHNQANRSSNVITVSASGANAGYVNFWDIPIFASDCSTVEAVGNNIDIRFIFYFLRSKQEFINQTMRSGAAQPHVYAKDIAQISLNLPPLAEQKRIATILDKANEIKAKRELALAKLDELSKSIFKEIKSLSKNTKKIKLKDATIKITDGTHHSPQITETGVPYITAKHLKFYGLDFYSKPWFISKEDHELIYKRCDPKKRDVLYIKDGATTGIAAINNYDFEFSMLSSLALIRVDEALLNPYYLKFWLNDVDVKNQLLGSMAGAAIQRFTLSKIKDFEVPLVNIDIQNKFELEMKEIEKNISLNRHSLTNITNCIVSLQNQAFTSGFNT